MDGLKTGHTDAAGYCIVATAKRQQTAPRMSRRVFVVVMGEPSADDRISDAGRLINYAFSAYKDYPSSDASGRRAVRSEARSAEALGS